MAMQIHMSRVILYVRDVVRLKEFYTTHLGLQVVEEIAGQWTVLQAGQMELALHLVGQAYRNTEPRGALSNAKLVFTVDSDLPSLRAELEKNGVSVGAIKRYSGFPYSLCDGLDPEGNVFQLSKPD